MRNTTLRNIPVSMGNTRRLPEVYPIFHPFLAGKRLELCASAPNNSHTSKDLRGLYAPHTLLISDQSPGLSHPAPGSCSRPAGRRGDTGYVQGVPRVYREGSIPRGVPLLHTQVVYTQECTSPTYPGGVWPVPAIPGWCMARPCYTRVCLTGYIPGCA